MLDALRMLALAVSEPILCCIHFANLRRNKLGEENEGGETCRDGLLD